MPECVAKMVKDGGLGPVGRNLICPIQKLCECFSDVGDIFMPWKISKKVGKNNNAFLTLMNLILTSDGQVEIVSPAN